MATPQLEKELEKISALKARLDAARPFPQGALLKLKEFFDVEWTYNSNAIEGNTLTLGETKLVILDGVTIGGKTVRDHLEAINHKKAIDYLEQVVQGGAQVSEEIVLYLHHLILREINDTEAGKYRSQPVYISGSRHVPPDAMVVPLKMQEFIREYDRRRHDTHPVLLAANVHYDFVTIHPFIDGNGRVARLLMNLVLMGSGYSPAIIPVGRRAEYIQILESAQLGGSRDPFYTLVAECAEYSLAQYLKALASA